MEIKIVKTWENIYFKTEKATEEMVSFRKDSLEVARERLKCIDLALDYVEKYL